MDFIKYLIGLLTLIQVILIPTSIYLLVSGGEHALPMMLGVFVIGAIKALLFILHRKRDVSKNISINSI
jgi:hypothetical protein